MEYFFSLFDSVVNSLIPKNGNEIFHLTETSGNDKKRNLLSKFSEFMTKKLIFQ